MSTDNTSPENSPADTASGAVASSANTQTDTQTNALADQYADPPSVQQLTQQLLDFRDARDWRQFHSLKDLILSVSLEASELVELTQWQPEAKFEEQARDPAMKQRLSEECADVFLYLLLVAERAEIDILAAARDKIAANNLKYPVAKSRGTSAKYTQL